MKTSRAGIDLIKKWEGLQLKSYKDPVGIWTIGYGITTAAGVGKVGPNMTITAQRAEEMLVEALTAYEAAVMKALTRSPTQNQFDAMVSLCWNIGPGAFAKSTLVKRFNRGDYTGVADAFLMWRKAGGKVLKGLVRRRLDEQELFLRNDPAKTNVRVPDPVSVPAAAPKPSRWARFISWLRKGA